MNGKKGWKSLEEELSNYQCIGLDTNIFIYYFNSGSEFYSIADKLITTVATQRIRLVTSMLTVTELLSFKTSDVFISRLQEELFSLPLLDIRDINQEIAIRAATIRRQYGFQLADSIQLATAISQKAEVFFTNDKRLRGFKELEVRLFSELKQAV